MESGVGVEPGSSCEPKLVVESEAWLKPRFGHWTGSPWKLQMMVDIGNRDIRNRCLSWLSLVCPCRSHPFHPLPSVGMMGPADLGEPS